MIKVKLIILQKKTSKLKRLILISALFSTVVSFAQRQGNIWYFGDHAGVNFNSGSPAPLTDGQTYSPDTTPIEGTAVISDSLGSLLFYTNGNKIWDKTHNVMPNGDSLFSDFSSTQSALIVAQPGSSRYFYVFTTDDFYVDDLQYGFRYSKVDICLNGGLGNVISSQKNIKLLDTVCEKLTAVRHANGTDYWIIVHKYYSDAFYSYHLSSSGITDTVISHVGSRHPNIAASQDPFASVGYLKASPDGSKLAIVNGNAGLYTIAEYFGFDKNTGVVSNWVNLQTNLAAQSQFYGVSFSPDNSKLYISCWLNGLGVYQFNLSAGGGNPDSVIASKTKITTHINSNNWGMQLAPDGKIYVAESGIKYLARINNPNNLGLSCAYQDSAFYLNGKTCSSGLPNFIDSYDYSNKTFVCNSTGIEYENNIQPVVIFPNPTSQSATLEFNNSKKENCTLTLYDFRGRLVRTINNITTGQVEIERQDLATGLYFFQLFSDKQIIANGKLAIE